MKKLIVGITISVFIIITPLCIILVLVSGGTWIDFLRIGAGVLATMLWVGVGCFITVAVLDELE